MVHDTVEIDREPTMYFRQVAFHRVLMIGKDDHGEQGEYQQSTSSELHPANCEAVTQISSKEICSDEGANVFFERSGTRNWSMAPDTYSKSSIPTAMAKIIDFLNPKIHHYQSNLSSTSSCTINDQILIRVSKRDECDDNVSEPTPEGIHQDGTEVSSVTLIHRENVLKEKGSESRIWNLKQPIGHYATDGGDDDQGFWSNCLFNKALDSPWETIIFNDRKVKHEAREFHKAIKNLPAYRDVIVNFVRKPLLDGSDKMLVQQDTRGTVSYESIQ